MFELCLKFIESCHSRCYNKVLGGKGAAEHENFQGCVALVHTDSTGAPKGRRTDRLGGNRLQLIATYAYVSVR